MKIDQVSGQHGAPYGKFAESALVAQNVKAAMRHSAGWHSLPADAREALEIMATKIAHILCGDPSYVDSWRDIEGYARLVADRLESSRSTSEDCHGAGYQHSQREAGGSHHRGTHGR